MVGEPYAITNLTKTDSRLSPVPLGKTYNQQKVQMKNTGNNIRERLTNHKTTYESGRQQYNLS